MNHRYSPWLRASKRFALALAAVYMTVVAVLYVFQDQLIFRSGIGVPDLQKLELPRLKEITIDVRDPVDGDLSLMSWYTPPIDPSLPTVLYFHGNGGHIGLRPKIQERFLDLGWGLLMLEYRGYGNNPGTPSVDGLQKDALAAAQFLQNKFGRDAKIHIYGESIGGAIAVQMLKHHPELPVKSLIIYAPFTKLSDVARLHYPWVPVGLLLKSELNTIDSIADVHVPLFIMHGENDTLVPPDMGRRVYANANQPKEIWIEPDADHFDLWEKGGVDQAINYIRRIDGRSLASSGEIGGVE